METGGSKERAGREGGSGTRHVKTYAIFRGKNREGFVLPARCWLEIGIFEGVPPLRTGLSCFAFQMARHSSPSAFPPPSPSSILPAPCVIFIIDPRIRSPLIRLLTMFRLQLCRESFELLFQRGQSGEVV